MSILLWLVTILPFLGALLLALLSGTLPKKAAGALGCASVGASWVLAMVVAGSFLQHGPSGVLNTTLYPWMNVGGLRVTMGLHLDALSVVMMVVISFVAFLIHLYASQSMYDEDDYNRFFCYMNLFVGSMLTLVLADNLLLLYLGWEGVGLCSYLLIGFWYRDRKNGCAAQKAFIVTRIGDAAMAVGLFLIFTQLGTLDIQSVLAAAPKVWPVAGAAVTTVALLLLGGAIGKSAQVPLQTWLPDAMAGPTPVSALIHAATMVTAGVYLIARMHVIFTMAPAAQLVVAIIGAVTLFYSGFSALVQRDIKRVLAYSTISQIGYMFLALGVGAWSGAIFHFMTHAFFKALLFLSAGVVIDALHREHDLFKMGGLRRRLPVAFWTFLVGAASLSALPLVTAGFYSKDAILWASWSSRLGGGWFWLVGTLGALLTAAYSFRALFLAFCGTQKTEIAKLAGGLMNLALVVLAFFSVVAGFVGMPEVLGRFDPFGHFMSSVFPRVPLAADRSSQGAEGKLLLISAVLSLLGIYLAYLYFKERRWSEAVAQSAPGRAVHRFFFAGWGFDQLYDWLFVRPFKAVAFGNRSDFIDKFFAGLGEAARYANIGLSATQTGRLRNYAAGIVLGAIVVGAIALLR